MRYLARQVLSHALRVRPLLRAASHSRKRTPLGSRTKQPLDDQDVPPGAVESAVATVQPDRREAATFDQSETGNVVGEELADHLVEAAALGSDRERFGERGTDATTPGSSVDVDAALPDPGVTRTSTVGAEPRPADNPSAPFGHQQRKTRIAHATAEITLRSRLRLERRPPLSDRSVVNATDRGAIIATGATHSESVASKHVWIVGGPLCPGNGRVSKCVWPAVASIYQSKSEASLQTLVRDIGLAEDEARKLL